MPLELFGPGLEAGEGEEAVGAALGVHVGPDQVTLVDAEELVEGLILAAAELDELVAVAQQVRVQLLRKIRQG
jgi:hypothetical protein